MESLKRKMNRSKHNNRYSIENRLELLRLVLEQKFSIKKAGDVLGFKRSTAKRIVQDYRNSGKLTRFKEQKRSLRQQEEKLALINGNCIEGNKIQISKQSLQIQIQHPYQEKPQWFHMNWPETNQRICVPLEPWNLVVFQPAFGYLNNWFY